MGFSKNIKTLRTGKGWTQSEAADNIGVKSHNIAAYEEGRSHPKYDDLKKIIKAFRIPDHKVVEFLFCDMTANDVESERPGKSYITLLEGFLFFLATADRTDPDFKTKKMDKQDQLQAAEAMLRLQYPDFFEHRKKWTDLENIV